MAYKPQYITISCVNGGDIWPGLPLFTGTACRSVGDLNGTGPYERRYKTWRSGFFAYFCACSSACDAVVPGRGGTCDLTLVNLWAESIQECYAPGQTEFFCPMDDDPCREIKDLKCKAQGRSRNHKNS